VLAQANYPWPDYNKVLIRVSVQKGHACLLAGHLRRKKKSYFDSYIFPFVLPNPLNKAWVKYSTTLALWNIAFIDKTDASEMGEIYIQFIPKCSKYSFRLLSVSMLGPGQQRRDLECTWKPQWCRPAKFNMEFKARSMHISLLAAMRLAKCTVFFLNNI